MIPSFFLLSDTGGVVVGAVRERGTQSQPDALHHALQQRLLLVPHPHPQTGRSQGAREGHAEVCQGHESRSKFIAHNYFCVFH